MGADEYPCRAGNHSGATGSLERRIDAGKNCTSTRAGFGVSQHYKQVLVTLLASGGFKKAQVQ